jgi:hypothetical protein
MRRRIEQLHEDLKRIVDRDAEQELDPIILPHLDLLIRAAKAFLPADDPVQGLSEFVSMEAMLTEDAQPARAMVMLIAAGQLKAALGPEPARASFPRGRLDDRRRNF